MAQIVINSGDTIEPTGRTAINSNFTELYSSVGGSTATSKDHLWFRRDGILTVQESNRFMIRWPFTIQEVSYEVDTAPTGSGLVVQIWKTTSFGGTPSNQFNRTLAVGVNSNSYTGQSIAYAKGDRISVAVVTQDSGMTAVGLTVTIGIVYS